MAFSIFSPVIRFKKKRMSHWPEPMSARTGQGEGSSANNWQEDEDRRNTTNLGGAKKDDDISVLLEDSDDEWIPGMNGPG